MPYMPDCAVGKAPIVLINADYHPTNFEATQRAGMHVELMSGVGHFVMLEDAATFNALLAVTVQRMVPRAQQHTELLLDCLFRR